MAIFLVSGLDSWASAASYLYCQTDKEEIDPNTSYLMSGDSNQRIAMPLEKQVVDGQEMLVSAQPQSLFFQFSQSTGGDSPWVLLVNKAYVLGSKLTLQVAVVDKRLTPMKAYLATNLYLQVGVDEDSGVVILNQKLSVRGKQVVYNMTEEDLNTFFGKLGKLVHAKQLVLNDFAYLEVNNCFLR